MNPGFVETEGCVRCGGPAGAQAEIAFGRTGFGGGIVSVAAIEEFGAGSVVGSKKDDGVIESAHGLELVEDAADLAIHATDHGGVNGHLGGLEFFLVRGEVVPGNGARDFVRADLFAKFGFSEIPVRDGFWLGIGQDSFKEAHLGLAFMTLLADVVPAGEVGVAIGSDVLGGGVQWEMRNSESEICEEGLVLELDGVITEALNGEIGEGSGGIIITSLRHRRKADVIEDVIARIEISVVVLEAVGAIKPAVRDGARSALNVPLARVVTAVAEGLQVMRQEAGPSGESAARRVHPDLLGIVTREERGAGRPAAGGVVKLSEAEAICGKAIEIRRGDFAAVGAEIGKTHVVREDEKNVGASGSFGRARSDQKHRE